VDEPSTFHKVQEYIKTIAPGQQNKVRLHSEKRPIFSRHQLEHQLETVHQANVRLRSGGSIVISPTEALVSIDVNSGKGTKEESLEETAFVTNMEAAEEVARQLRLRDLGGVVVVDFIDMRDDKHRREVERKLREATKADKAKMDFASISKFGLLELTRQRLRPPIEAGIYTTCPHCKGKGQVYTPESASLAFLRLAAQMLSMKGGLGTLKAKLNHEVANYVLNNKRSELIRLEERHKTKILILGDPTFAPSYHEIETEKRAHETDQIKPGQVAKAQECDDEAPGNGKSHWPGKRPPFSKDDPKKPRKQFRRPPRAAARAFNE
jgi:ribonuclease E